MKIITREQLNKILKQHKLWLDTNGKKGKQADLSCTDLSGLDLTEANLRKADLTQANLCKADLTRADLKGVILKHTNLIKANLKEAILIGANLLGAELEDTNITTFYLGKDFGFYHEGFVEIACEGMQLDEWLENYKKVGKEAGYTDREIERYKDQLDLLKKWEIKGLI